MARKFSLLTAAIAVLALAIPAMASATPTTTDAHTFPSSLPVGTLISTTSTVPPKFTSSILGTIECSSLSMLGELKVNSGGTVTTSSGGKFTSSGCTNNGNPVTVTSFNVTDLSSTVSGKGTTSFTSIIDLGGITCRYTATSIPFTYEVGGSNITFNKAGTIDGSPAGCGTGTFDATLTVEFQESGSGTWKDVKSD